MGRFREGGTGWSAGQVGLVRMATALAVGVDWIPAFLGDRGGFHGMSGPGTGLVVLALAGLLAFGLATREVAAALELLTLGAWVEGLLPARPLASGMLLLLALAPAAPALVRAAESAGWSLPRPFVLAARVLVLGVGLVLLTGATRAVEASWFPALLLASPLPRLAPARAVAPVHVLYDGGCSFCHASVLALLAEDRAGILRFAPLGGATHRRLLPGSELEELPATMLVLEEGREPCERWRAVRRLLALLGGGWRILAILSRPLPAFVMDLEYDLFAGVRRRILRPPQADCPDLPPRLAERFDP